MPWRNGGGVTHELHVEGTGAAGFAVRLSIAEVAQDGPFSRFPGVDRVIALLAGPGFVLRREDGVEARVLRVGQAFAFHGEDAWNCTLPGGPVQDFNVMVDRAWGRASVRRVEGGLVDARWVLALADEVVGGERLAAGELAELLGLVRVEGPALGVWVDAAIR